MSTLEKFLGIIIGGVIGWVTAQTVLDYQRGKLSGSMAFLALMLLGLVLVVVIVAFL